MLRKLFLSLGMVIFFSIAFAADKNSIQVKGSDTMVKDRKSVV